MKKIPTLFERVYENHRIVDILPKVTPGMEWVLEGKGQATVKYDGSCCAIIGGKFYKRYDAKNGKKPPVGAIPCCEPDPVTGHWPHWVRVNFYDPADKWFIRALNSTFSPVGTWTTGFDEAFNPLFNSICLGGTYEAVGQHFQGNPYGTDKDVLLKHGTDLVLVERTFDGIKKYLTEHNIEGLVFWKGGEPQCKIKRTDFGLQWPSKED